MLQLFILFKIINTINELCFSIALKSNNEIIVIKSIFYTQIYLKNELYKNLSNKLEFKN